MNKDHTTPTAAEFMQRRVQTISPDASLEEVIQFLRKHKLSNAPVVEKKNGGQFLVGFLSERDCLSALSKEAFFGNPSVPQTAGTMMRTQPICVSPTAELFTLASIFVNHDFRHLPVVDDGLLLGIVSRRDVLQAMESHYQQEIKLHDEEHFPRDLHQLVNHRFITQNRN